MSRVNKTLKSTGKYPHREHRSKRGRSPYRPNEVFPLKKQKQEKRRIKELEENY